MVGKQDEVIVSLLAQQQKNQMNLRMANMKLGFLQMQLQALTTQLLHFRKGDEGVSTHPHPMCYVELMDKNIANVQVMVFVVCNGPLPLGDIIVYNCWHLYHPWCATILFKSASSCKEEQCMGIHPKWLKSFGFASPIVELEEKAANMDYEMVWRMAITQRKIVVQSIHPTIGSSSCLIHSFFGIHILVYMFIRHNVNECIV